MKNKSKIKTPKTQKVVISTCYGGFGLSEAAISRAVELGHIATDTYKQFDDDQSNPILVQVVEELGDAANTRFSELKVIEIPGDVKWVVEEYDGLEHIAEAHRIWA